MITLHAAPCDRHRFFEVRIMRCEDETAARLLNEKQPVAFLQIEPRRRVLWQNEADRIADPAHLKGARLDLGVFRFLVHGTAPLYRMYNTTFPSVQQMFYMDRIPSPA